MSFPFIPGGSTSTQPLSQHVSWRNGAASDSALWQFDGRTVCGQQDVIPTGMRMNPGGDEGSLSSHKDFFSLSTVAIGNRNIRNESEFPLCSSSASGAYPYSDTSGEVGANEGINIKEEPRLPFDQPYRVQAPPWPGLFNSASGAYPYSGTSGEVGANEGINIKDEPWAPYDQPYYVQVPPQPGLFNSASGAYPGASGEVCGNFQELAQPSHDLKTSTPGTPEAKAQEAFRRQEYRNVYTILESNKFEPSSHKSMQELWNKAHYAEAEQSRGKQLGAVDRFRIRGKYPPPLSIWNGEKTSYLLKDKSRNRLEEFYSEKDYPLPKEKESLAHETELTYKQVSNWFKNKRQRQRQRQRQCEEASRNINSTSCPQSHATGHVSDHAPGHVSSTNVTVNSLGNNSGYY